jgi:hypothetical protein
VHAFRLIAAQFQIPLRNSLGRHDLFAYPFANLAFRHHERDQFQASPSAGLFIAAIRLMPGTLYAAPSLMFKRGYPER